MIGDTSIQVDSNEWDGVETAWLLEMLQKAIGQMTARFAAVTVRVVDDAEMTLLHERHCGMCWTTDVLTFVLSEANQPLEVDIAVCADEAERQAKSRRHELSRELLLYVVHGLLHCAGHDDQNEADRDVMHLEEDRILRMIGVGATYAPSREDERGMDQRLKGRGR